MKDQENNISSKKNSQNIVLHTKISLIEALIPVIILVCFLFYNILYASGELFGSYSNSFILLIAAVLAAGIGVFNKVSLKTMLIEILKNLKSVRIPILILFLVGALAGTWLVSGVIPAMIYYGLQILNPKIFLPACVIISALISIATGSSWTTSATVGIALVGIGSALGIDSGVIAGAVISGAYFGDKMSPLSDTTNLAPAMAGTDLFTHIKYMSYTTIPSILVTLVIFSILSLNIKPSGETDISSLLKTIETTFYISPWLFLVPLTVILLILLKTKPLLALGSGVLLAAVCSLMFQSKVLNHLGETNFVAVANSIITETLIITENDKINDLFTSGGMQGMLWTIYLIISAMVFGGVMDGIGALSRITNALLKIASTVFGLFTSTIVSCIGLNIVAADQYLAIVIPGKMFKKAYKDRGLAPENLSRTLEDSGTVTSVLIPWNTCGAYQSGVLGVNVADYFIYAIFNWLSPISSLIFAALSIKIRQLSPIFER